MDVQELSVLIQMQNQTHQLLQELQNKQQTCKKLLDTSLSSHASDSRQSSLTSQNENSLSLDICVPEGVSQVPRAGQGTQVKAHFNDALTAHSKMSSYRRVAPCSDTPTRRPQFKLPQGIDYSQMSHASYPEVNRAHYLPKPESGTHMTNGIYSDQKENMDHMFDLDFEEDQGKANTSVTFQDQHLFPDSSEKSLSSTPKRVPTTLVETPKSILKRRKIIDDNVIVESKYPHTPTGSLNTKTTNGLNYSYSGIDDLEVPGSTASNGKARYNDATNGSYTEECFAKSPGNEGTVIAVNDADSDLNRLMEERLLLDAGNDRRNANVILELDQRPKSYIFQPVDQAGSSQPSSQNTRQKVKSSPNVSKKLPARTADATSSSGLWRSRDQPLLGYDWIAGVLDNESSLFNLPDDYFRDIQKFRSNNKTACVGDNMLRSKLDPSRPISPEVQDPGHQCLHGFTVNDRLFTEPMNSDDQGRSACPVCLISRKEPNQQSPGFVRVSIPRSTLEKPYRVKPHRRRSYDSTDTFALSKHCQAGYECSLPTTIPTAKNIDLKGANGIQGKQAMSLQEAEDFIKSHSRSARTLSKSTSSNPPNLPKTRDVTAESFSKNDSQSSSRRHHQTSALLNMSHSLRYDLQDLARKKGKDRHRKPHSTDYPTF